MNLLNISKYPFVYHDEEYIYLYKHVNFSNGSLAILKDGTIRFTPPNEFNDPFDCVYGISKDHFHSAQELKRVITQAGIGQLSPAKRLLLAKRVSHIQKKEMNDLSYFKKLHANFGVCCLNHNPLNILMWSHYAKNHTGFLIEFKFLKNELNKGNTLLEFLPIPVNYAEKIPVVSKSDRLNLDGMVITEKVYLTKSEVWEYEKEFRILKYNIINEIQAFSQQKFLCSIIAGLKMGYKNRDELERICKQKHIPFYITERISNAYGLTVPNHPRLDVLTKNS